MPKGRGNGQGTPGKRTGTPRSMNKPAMMDWALRLLRLLNERKVLNSRIVAEEFDVNIRTAQRYLRRSYGRRKTERSSSLSTSTTRWISGSTSPDGCRFSRSWNRRGIGILSAG